MEGSVRPWIISTFRSYYDDRIFLEVANNNISGVISVIKNNRKTVNQLDKYGWTPLHIASEYGYTEICEELLKNGALFDAMEPELQQTPLHLAAVHGHHGVAKLLLKAGADVQALDYNGCSPLHHACMRGHSICLEVLCEGYHAHRDILLVGADKHGWTPIHYAASYGHSAAVQVLLNHGCHVDQVRYKYI